MPDSVSVPVITPVDVPNPYVDFGLDAQGNPLPAAPLQAPAPVDPRDTRIAALEAKLGTVDAVNEKFALVDRLVKAVAGDDGRVTSEKYAEVFNDLKRISPPGVRRALELLESNPQALEQLTGSVNALHVDRLVSLNQSAHGRIVELAGKAGFKAANTAEMNTMVFPFERAVTEIINSTPELKTRFISGDVAVVDEVFKQLVSPHVGQRVREKKARLLPNRFPMAPPLNAPPSSTSDGNPTSALNLHTPQGKAAFHKQAVAGWLNKISSGGDDN